MASLIFGRKYANQSWPYLNDRFCSNGLHTISVTFTAAVSHTLVLQSQMARRNLPINSPSIQTNTAKGQHWLSMSGWYTANSLLTQVALTSPEHVILHSGPKLCIGRLQRFYAIHLFLLFVCFCFSFFVAVLIIHEKNDQTTQNMIYCKSYLRRWHFRGCIANMSVSATSSSFLIF